MGTAVHDGAASQGLFGRTRTAILSLLYGHPNERYYLRQLVRETGAGNGAIQREVRQLAAAGLLLRTTEGNQVFYQANHQSPVFSELRSLLLKTSGVRDVLRRALAPLSESIRVAFVYGSIAEQNERAGSDVDLMIVGSAGFEEVTARLSGAEKRLGREINPSIYSTDDFRSKMRAGNHFLTSVTKRAKLFILGNENDLRELSAKRLANQTSKQR